MPGLDPLADVGDRLRDDRSGRGDAVDLGGALPDDHAAAPSPSSSSAAAISAATSPMERGVQRHELPGRPVALDDRLGLLVVDREAPGDRVRLVVATPLLGRPAGDPLERDLVGDVEEEHRVERAADLGEHLVELLGLGQVPREPVEHEAVRCVELRRALADERDGQLVGDELARREERLDLPAELRPLRSPRGTSPRQTRRRDRAPASAAADVARRRRAPRTVPACRRSRCRGPLRALSTRRVHRRKRRSGVSSRASSSSATPSGASCRARRRRR